MRTWIGVLSSYPGDRPTSPSQDGHLLLPGALLQRRGREGLADPEDLSRSFEDFREARFLHALNYCMLLPGPEAQQLATYVGWLLHNTRGSLMAGAFFIIPSMLILWSLSYIYVACRNLPWIAAIFYGLKPAIVAAAVIRIGSRALKNEVMWTLAAAAFVAIFFVHLPFPLIILSAAAIGFVGGKWKRDKFLVIRGHGQGKADLVLDDTSAVPDHAKPSWPRAVRIALIWAILWLTPIALLSLWLGNDHTVVREGWFFSKAALVTFGGSYAVLPYVAHSKQRKRIGSRSWSPQAPSAA
jgi:chromate transporter